MVKRGEFMTFCGAFSDKRGGFREPGSKSGKARTKNQEPRTKNQEPGRGLTKHDAPKPRLSAFFFYLGSWLLIPGSFLS